ncbi:DUF3618 domain-containing protein [Micromonospora sp. HM5-17]|jgi:hypothetical protein|uniref:DUF3618 domain-containing protein n=1 Tax=Micromonospora sp. HM5-17 TaxID=2487710 RepID=UPI000F47CF30|nr:DUF3618 domain-containing protein [Micromonospora sp. HM5-17]ROT33243.1 DUF3618 domain-containing protein [Micromonospora sp. HM5-17]
MTRSNGSGNPEALRAEIRQTRAELSETVQALAAKADVKARLKGSAAQTRDRMRQRAGQTTANVRNSLHDAGAVALRHPIPWAAAAAGALALVALLVVARARRR